MNKLSKTLIISGLAGFLILSGCSKETVKNDTVYKVEGNSTVSTTSGTIPNAQPHASENNTKVPNFDNGGLLSQTEIQELVKKTSGTWVNENWISNLKKTKSIINSTSAMPALYVSKGDSGLLHFEGPTDDFHQGGVYSTSTNDVYKVTDLATSNKFFKVKVDSALNSDVIKENKKDEAFILISNNADKLEYYYGDIKRSFIKISETSEKALENYANNIILAGKYVDEKGSSYTFTNDGFAIWPNSKDKYLIDLNATYSQLDNVFIGDITGKYSRYCYEIKDKVLYLYKVTSEENIDLLKRDKTPYLVLKNVE